LSNSVPDAILEEFNAEAQRCEERKGKKKDSPRTLMEEEARGGFGHTTPRPHPLHFTA